MWIWRWSKYRISAREDLKIPPFRTFRRSYQLTQVCYEKKLRLLFCRWSVESRTKTVRLQLENDRNSKFQLVNIPEHRSRNVPTFHTVWRWFAADRSCGFFFCRSIESKTRRTGLEFGNDRHPQFHLVNIPEHRGRNVPTFISVDTGLLPIEAAVSFLCRWSIESGTRKAGLILGTLEIPNFNSLRSRNTAVGTFQRL